MTFSDFLVSALPIPIVASLQMPRLRRVGVAILLSMGMLVGLAGIPRVYYVWLANVGSYDLTWYLYPVYMITTVEMDIGIVSFTLSSSPCKTVNHKVNCSYASQVCASVPALRRLWSKPKGNSSSYVRSTGTEESKGRSAQGSSGFAVSTNSSGRGTDPNGFTMYNDENSDVELAMKDSASQAQPPWGHTAAAQPERHLWHASR
jgi:hypothetical protein